ncbi:MAG TPA: GAF domain-containing protein [Candidatus Binatia bacterium]|nr:GAF domain-containing protein [Candidatus Binatia bacterium]
MATQASDTANSTASKKARGASPDDLAVVAQRAQAFTNASGVAIALSEGNADEIVCRARSGSSAPEVGAALRVDGTFTGLCIQTGKELRCDDCETDTRVDTAAIRALGIRSMVVTPIREDNRVVGVLAAFAPTPHAFTITHVAVLKTMADQISALLQKERRAREENPQAEEPKPAAPAITAKPVVVPAPAQTTSAPPAVVIKPSSSAPRAAAPAPARTETVKSVPLEVVPLATPPRKEEKRAEASPRTSFGTLDSMATEEKKPGNRFMMIGVVAVLVIAAASTFAFLKMQRPKAAAPQQTQEAANVPPAAPSTNVQPVSPAANGTTSSQSAPNTIVMPPATKPVAEKPAAKTVAEKNSSPAEKPAPAEKPVTVATLGSTGASRIARQNSAVAAPEVAPSFTADSGNASAPLSSLARPVSSSAPSAAAIEQSQLEPLQVIRTGPLVYPAIAKARGITGPAVVQVTVGKDGKPYNPKFISGQPIFKDASFQAVMGYVFKPAKLNGQPIEQSTTIRLNFH